MVIVRDPFAAFNQELDKMFAPFAELESTNCQTTTHHTTLSRLMMTNS